MNLIGLFGAWLSFGGGDKKFTLEPHAVERTKEPKGRPNAQEALKAAKKGKLIPQGNGVYKAVDGSRTNVNVVCVLVEIPAGVVAGGGLGYSVAGLTGMYIAAGLGGGAAIYRIVTAYFRNKSNKI